MRRELDLLEKLEKELNLKQLQIKSLLTITQAINDNVSASGLFNMYKSFLSWEMGIEKMALFIPNDHGWKCAAEINLHQDINKEELIPLLLQYQRLHTIKETDDSRLGYFDIIIPVFHKSSPIAYAIIGGIRDKEDLYNRIQFITTITNIIAVAIENKRLFNQQIERERLKKEIELASEVQKMLIPKNLPTEERFQLSSIYMPHLNVGGDYFDYIKFEKERFAICIADISGKGVAAALLMANFQAIIQSLIYQYRDLETFVFALNQSVHRITKSDRFITFFIAEINIDKKELKYINAGHYPPVMKQGKKLIKLDKGCTVIGAFETLPEIMETTLELADENLVLCFTDGLADLRNSHGEFFEIEKIDEFVEEYSTLNANDFNQRLMEDIDGFRGEMEYPDDIAILTCKIYC